MCWISMHWVSLFTILRMPLPMRIMRPFPEIYKATENMSPSFTTMLRTRSKEAFSSPFRKAIPCSASYGPLISGIADVNKLSKQMHSLPSASVQLFWSVCFFPINTKSTNILWLNAKKYLHSQFHSAILNLSFQIWRQHHDHYFQRCTVFL